MTILLVDDDPITVELLKAVLENSGHEVVVARNGEDAWMTLARQRIQVVISDWMMPKLDGLDLCQRIRARRTPEYIYFILITARSGKENYFLANEKGVDDFLTKPLRQDELQTRLRVAGRILGFIRQVSDLKRLLPICSYCKRIRDDKDYWHQIESYIHDHTGADFSHSICPECFEKVVKPQLQETPPD